MPTKLYILYIYIRYNVGHVVNRYSRLGVTRAAGIHNRKVVNIGTYCTRVSNQESREKGFGISVGFSLCIPSFSIVRALDP